jgi:nucleoid DNA-binding protein
MRSVEKPATCIDMLVWVGSASHQFQFVDQFIIEAKVRGCCRQLPHSEDWMMPGKTRVFLAHRNGHQDKARGSVFGYFVLKRIEVITESNVAASLAKLDFDRLLPIRLGSYNTLVKNLKAKKQPKKQIKAKLKEKLHREHVSKMLRGEVSRASDILPRGSDIADMLKKALRDVLKHWLDHHHSVSHTTSKCEGERGCSTRKGPGSVYVVDALCAAINNEHKQKLLEELAKRKSSADREQFVRDLHLQHHEIWRTWFEAHQRRRFSESELKKVYKDPFLDSVNRVSKTWEPRFPPDLRLRRKATQHGELVVFDRRPVYHVLPQAAFRGFRRIDGDDLIRQVSGHKGDRPLTLSIPYCVDEEFQGMTRLRNAEAKRKPTKIRTQGQLAALLAERLGLSKAASAHFLHQITSVAHEQLHSFGKFKIEGIGTIFLKKTARKPVKFAPSTTLVNSSDVKR